MLRKHSIIKYVFLILLAIIGVVLCVVPFNVPASTNRYNGLVGAITKDFDLRGGVSAIYVLDGSNNAESIDANLDKIKKIIDYDRIGNYSIYRQGENKIRFDVAGASETDTIFSNLASGKELSVTLEKADDTNANPTIYITSKDVEYAYGNYDSTGSSYGVQIEFTTDTNIKTMKDIAKTLSKDTAYVYVGNIESGNLLAEVKIEDFSKSIFVTSASGSSYSTSTYADCREIAYSITTGVFGKEISLEEACYISPILGKQTLLLLGISSLVIVALSFLFMGVRYKDLGLISILSLTFFLIINIFLLQAIPGIVLNINGYFGVVLGFAVAMVSHVMLLEKIRKEYAIGKKIHIACKGGFKGSLWQILDTHFLFAIAGVIMWIVAPSSVKCFAVTLLIGLLVSAFAIEGLMRYFIKSYLPINASNAKRMGLYRDENVVEIKEDEDVASNVVEGGQTNE